MAKAYTNITENPADVTDWLMAGLMYLLPKTEETKNLKNYGPIIYY